ncbi:hypothetical protein, partial [Falsiroseomonas selenitidurans]|nr:hypothetical protein [Falsiroseomonas selenitidurans]
MREPRAVHPAAWGVALALHAGLALLMLRPAPLSMPAGSGGLVVGLSGGMAGGGGGSLDAVAPDPLAPAGAPDAAAADAAPDPLAEAPAAGTPPPPDLPSPPPPQALTPAPPPAMTPPPAQAVAA